MKMSTVLFGVMILLMGGCVQGERSAGRALESAGSVIKSGEEKLWEETPEQKSRRRAEEQNRY